MRLILTKILRLKQGNFQFLKPLPEITLRDKWIVACARNTYSCAVADTIRSRLA